MARKKVKNFVVYHDPLYGSMVAGFNTILTGEKTVFVDPDREYASELLNKVNPENPLLVKLDKEIELCEVTPITEEPYFLKACRPADEKEKVIISKIIEEGFGSKFNRFMRKCMRENRHIKPVKERFKYCATQWKKIKGE